MQDTFTPPAPAVPPQKSNMTLVVVALGLGLLVALISALYTANIRAKAQADMQTVWRLKLSVSVDEVFSVKKHAATVDLPRVAIEHMTDVITDKSVLGNWEGQPFKRAGTEGEMISTGLFQDSGSLSGTIKKIDPENRLCSLPINGRTAPAGLRPGMEVDLLVTITAPGQLPATHLAMEKVMVRGVGTNTNETGGTTRSYSSITVEVNPDEAVALVAISNSPQVSAQGFALLIRPPNVTPKSLGVSTKVLDILRIDAPKGASGG